VTRPAFLPEGGAPAFSPEDTWDSDYGSLLELAHRKGFEIARGRHFVPMLASAMLSTLMALDNALVDAFANWVDKVLAAHRSTPAAAYNFNLYEHSDTFAVQLAGTTRYDPADPDWACDETFSSGEDLFEFPRTQLDDDWREGLLTAKSLVVDYLTRGKNAKRLISSQAVCTGFVDGDIEPVYVRD
jgi:hypothetical protein